MAIRVEFGEIAHFPSKIGPKSAPCPPNAVFVVYIVRYAFLTPGMGYRPFGLVHGRRLMECFVGNLQEVSTNSPETRQNCISSSISGIFQIFVLESKI